MEPRTGLWPLAAPGMSMAYSSKRESPVDVPCQLRSSRGGGEAWLTRERLERLTKRTIWRGTGGLTHGAWTRLWHDGPRTREPPQRCERCSRAVPAPKAPKLAHLASDPPTYMYRRAPDYNPRPDTSNHDNQSAQPASSKHLGCV